MSKLKMPWKKNFRRVPEWALRRVRESIDNELIVSCIKKISSTEITAGKYNHLGLTTSEDSPTYPESLIPDAQVGRFSARNANGYEVVRRDLPKVKKNFGPYEVPIYGDPGRGYCDVIIPRMVYLRDLISPSEWKIAIKLIEREFGTGDFVFRFQVDQTLNRTEKGFDEGLFFALNLLQENTGGANVFRANASTAEFLGTISVNWEILPPGEDTRERILSSFVRATTEVQERINSRFDLLNTLNPVAFINGTNGFDRYFGAKFSERLVVFENMNYGNAAYIMNQSWQELSQRSRIELLRDRPEGFSRIVHADGWENRLRDVVSGTR